MGYLSTCTSPFTPWLAKKPLPVIDRETALKSLLHAPVEQLSPGRELVLCRDVHPLADAAYSAFYDHRPLVLSPDAVWFCLVQGLAHHISLNALTGTPDDWRSVRRRASMLSEFGLEWWTTSLLPVLDQVVRSVDTDRKTRALTYEEDNRRRAEARVRAIRKPVRNQYLPDWQARLKAAQEREWLSWNNHEGPWLGALPSGTASAPVLLTDLRDNSEHPLRFVAGLVGVSQDASGALAPEFGWAVVHEPK